MGKISFCMPVPFGFIHYTPLPGKTFPRGFGSSRGEIRDKSYSTFEVETVLCEKSHMLAASLGVSIHVGLLFAFSGIGQEQNLFLC